MQNQSKPMTLNIRRHSRLQRPAGFTLVELLVVVAIIGILVGMLLPAVQQVREAARRTSCASKIAQIGLALHNYEFSREHLPAGTINNQGPIRTEEIGQHVSFLVTLLPFVEQKGIANNFDSALGSYAAANAPARAMEIESYTCPTGFLFGGINPTTNYAGCHHGNETQIADDNNGLLFLNSRIALTDIFDGSSNTILLGEILPLEDSLGWASGTRASLRNMSVMHDRAIIESMNTSLPLPVDEVGSFGSDHPAGANFCIGDGSVQFLLFSMNAKLMNQLGDRQDGAMMGNPFN